ncbi:MAG TPA: sortase [Candidatus Paceibacterota bacterium]|nr:sortase [Candidatus Paceibacterota bacterium]
MASNHTSGKKTSRTAAFWATFVLLFALTYSFLAVVDALPDHSQNDIAAHSTDTPSKVTSPELPVRVIAKDIGLDAVVVNPTSTNVDTLDDALTQGAVRYPTSAQLGVDGTVLIFGHSSYLPVVYHQYYKTFDGIQNLKQGQTISVYSGTTEYRYTVTGIRVADATQDVVELPSTGKHLVLVTCDSFATKSNRFIVTADFVGTYALSSK